MFRLIVIIIAIGLVLAGGLIFAVSYTERLSPQVEAVELVELEEEILPEETGPSSAELIIRILAAAYPQRIEKAEFRNDDWAVLIDDTWYYYAGGRMLPEELMERVDEYTGSVGIYNYQSELPPWTDPTPEQSERYRSMGNTRDNSDNSGAPRIQRERSNHFREALWQSSSYTESSRRVRSINFLGKTVVVHSGIAEVLSHVEARIRAIAETDPEVRSWMTGIGEVHGWNWRNVANSQSRSNHSYGIAVDILPKSLNGKQTYWQWASQSGRDWWNVPYTDRYHPPEAVIKTFEAYGFTWGGKWTYFDTMHFEYRPEVFIMSGLELITVQ
jgi:hypothetical protein